MDEKKIIVPRFKKENGYTTSESRSKLMAKIKAKNTIPELMLRRELWKINIRYRLHNKELPGNPDIVNKKYKFAIFVDGEFWHGFEWEKKKEKISSNRGFWIPKIERNMQRDAENSIKLENMGYKVFRFWERAIKRDMHSCIERITNYIADTFK